MESHFCKALMQFYIAPDSDWFVAYRIFHPLCCADGSPIRGKEMASYLLSKLTARLNKACVRISLSQCSQKTCQKRHCFVKGLVVTKAIRWQTQSLWLSCQGFIFYVYNKYYLCNEDNKHISERLYFSQRWSKTVITTYTMEGGFCKNPCKAETFLLWDHTCMAEEMTTVLVVSRLWSQIQL